MHDYAAPLTAIRDAVGVLDAREPMPGKDRVLLWLDRILLWLDARAAAAELAVVLRDLETDATDAIVELARETGSDELETALGVVHVGQTSPSERWDGYRLIGKLARTVVEVDPVTGELATEASRAVPVDVLRDVVAGCQTDKLTSSKWRKTGLRDHGIDVWKFYDRDDPRPIIRTGPRR